MNELPIEGFGTSRVTAAARNLVRRYIGKTSTVPTPSKPKREPTVKALRKVQREPVLPVYRGRAKQ